MNYETIETEIGKIILDYYNKSDNWLKLCCKKIVKDYVNDYLLISNRLKHEICVFKEMNEGIELKIGAIKDGLTLIAYKYNVTVKYCQNLYYKK